MVYFVDKVVILILLTVSDAALLGAPNSVSLVQKGLFCRFFQEDEIANILLKKKIILLLFVYQNLQIGGYKFFDFFCCCELNFPYLIAISFSFFQFVLLRLLLI
jgi:hypothetical protein